MVDRRAKLVGDDTEAPTDLAKETDETSGTLTPKKLPVKRLHFLDWIRLLMVLGVVYAHTAKSGITTGGGFNEAWLVDDRTLFDHKDYVELYANLKSQGGAAVACSYRGGLPRGLPKLAGFTLLGMGFNAILWFLGPLDDRCFVGNPDCKGKGLVFSFTIVPWAGPIFAILFQMWYTVMLMGFALVNWPLLSVVYGSASRIWYLAMQLCTMMVIYISFLVSADREEVPWQLLRWLAATEVVFIGLIPLTAPSFEGFKRPRWLPLRLVHYLLAIVATVQFGALPFAEQMESIGATYILYMFVGFNRFYNLGFIMTIPQLSPEGDKAEPLLSTVWPLALVLFTCVAPSTNWDLAGMLTYPFFILMSDRVLYVAGAVCMVFLLDRCSRSLHCEALPGVLSQTSLILYLFHPVLVTVLLHFGMRSVPHVCLACDGMALAIAALLEWSWSSGAPSVRKESQDAADSASSEEE